MFINVCAAFWQNNVEYIKTAMIVFNAVIIVWIKLQMVPSQFLAYNRPR